ncbi:MAG: hypothetical protein SFT81_04940 [Candidatus Caenarcaniphilales bacterium]|nr:hypothetical protein [Candidatus Caenarcaniphilales bacterium]
MTSKARSNSRSASPILAKLKRITKLLQQEKPTLTEERNSRHKPLDLLILLILNQSTSDALSDRAFAQLKKDYSSYEAILKENNPQKLTKSIQVCGLAPTKSIYVLNALSFLERNYTLDIAMPYIDTLSDQEALKLITSIKGVGIKSASCLLMFGFKRSTFAIDTHIFRILKRLGGLVPEKANTEQLHYLLQPIITSKIAFTLHVGLVEHGRAICHARKPLCHQCILSKECDFYKEIVKK